MCVTCSGRRHLFGCSLKGTVGTGSFISSTATFWCIYGRGYAQAWNPIFAGSVVKTTDLPTDFIDLTHPLPNSLEEMGLQGWIEAVQPLLCGQKVIWEFPCGITIQRLEGGFQFAVRLSVFSIDSTHYTWSRTEATKSRSAVPHSGRHGLTSQRGSYVSQRVGRF